MQPTFKKKKKKKNLSCKAITKLIRTVKAQDLRSGLVSHKRPVQSRENKNKELLLFQNMRPSS